MPSLDSPVDDVSVLLDVYGEKHLLRMRNNLTVRDCVNEQQHQITLLVRGLPIHEPQWFLKYIGKMTFCLQFMLKGGNNLNRLKKYENKVQMLCDLFMADGTKTKYDHDPVFRKYTRMFTDQLVPPFNHLDKVHELCGAINDVLFEDDPI